MREPSEYPAVTDFLFGQKARGVSYGIDRMRKLAAVLGHPERAVPAIHIAGTNGKGSVAAMVETILRTAGWRTGLHTSPHLVHLGERVQVARERLTETEIIEYVRELRPMGERLAAENPDDRPSFFEYMTAMAFLQFSRRQCDVAIIEVGLGGRLDATNILTPEVSVITSIALDHEEFLGRELEQIAFEKAGIIKPGRPVVIGRMPPVAERRIRAIAAERDAPLVSVAEKYGLEIGGYPRTCLEGDHQRWNAATATETVRALADKWRITDEVIARGLAQVDWPGRWQRVQLGGRLVILDASHNSEGAQTLDANLDRLRAETGRAPIVIVGVLGVARAGPLIEMICRHAGEIRFVSPNEPRACSPEELEAAVPSTFRGRIASDTVENIFPGPGVCTAGGPDDVIVVTGSIYLLGEVMTRLGAPGR